jgi:hypothetical protein
MSFFGTLLGGAAGFMLGGPQGAMMGASLGGGLDASKAASKASDIQAQSASQATEMQKQIADQQIALQREMYQQTRDDQAPFRAAGVNALAQMQRTAGNVPGAFSFGMNDFNADPGYAFRLSEGQKALDRQAAARGGLISGGALKAAQRYGQDMGSQEYQNAYNRALTGYNSGVASENQLYNRQAGLAGIGQTSTNLTNQAGQNYSTGVGNSLGAYGTNAGNNMMAGANARASGYVGGANALTGGLSNAANIYQNNQMMNQMQANGLNQRYGMGNTYFPSGQYGSSLPTNQSQINWGDF